MENRLPREKRKYLRLDTLVNVKYKILDDALLEGQSISKNLSPEGIKFPIKEKLVSGTKIQLVMDIPGESRPVSARGEVVWQHEIEGSKRNDERFDTGLKFTHIEDNSKKGLFGYIYAFMSKMLDRLE